MPIKNFLSCTRVFDEFESLSPAQRRHAKTYATGLVAASNKTVAGIAREVLPANSKRALSKFLTEKAGDAVPSVGHFYDHAEGDTVWGQDLIYAFYTDDKTAYPFTFRLYEHRRPGRCPGGHLPLRLLVRPRFWPS